MVHVLRQRHEGMFVLNADRAPGLGLRLERTDHQLAGIFLVVVHSSGTRTTGMLRGNSAMGSDTM